MWMNPWKIVTMGTLRYPRKKLPNRAACGRRPNEAFCQKGAGCVQMDALGCHFFFKAEGFVGRRRPYLGLPTPRRWLAKNTGSDKLPQFEKKVMVDWVCRYILRVDGTDKLLVKLALPRRGHYLYVVSGTSTSLPA